MWMVWLAVILGAVLCCFQCAEMKGGGQGCQMEEVALISVARDSLGFLLYLETLMLGEQT
jgi:hypothetical protein